jgi:formate-nitrite transporter family protein
MLARPGPLWHLMVILARQQLFTESTITIMREPNARNFWRLASLWSVVYLSNMAGTLNSAVFCQFAPALTSETLHAHGRHSRETMSNSACQMFFKGISSGFLIAAMMWAIPSAEAAKFHIVTPVTYLSRTAALRIVAGSMAAFLLVTNSELSAFAMLLRIALPVLFKNIVGGTALFALNSCGQAMHEI